MKTDTAERIVRHIHKNKQSTAKKLAHVLAISPQALFRQLAKLQRRNLIYKIGTPPRVFYFVRDEIQPKEV